MANAPDVQDLNPQFLGNVSGLLEAVKKAGGNPSIASGYRTYAQQQYLVDNPSARAPGAPAAPAGSSLHEKGLAADLSGDSKTMGLLHSLAPQYGLAFPFGNDPNHAQPIDLSRYSDAGPTSGVGAAPAQTNGPMPLKDRLNALAAMFDSGGNAPSIGGAAPTSSIATPTTGSPTVASGVSTPSSGSAMATNAVGTSGVSDLANASEGDTGAVEGQAAAVVPSGKTTTTKGSADNQALGQNLAKQFGWDQGAQWSALNNVIMQESGWDPNAANPRSSARGIGQNIHGWSNDYQQGNAEQQINWTLNYIQKRYGSPQAAWAHEQSQGWY